MSEPFTPSRMAIIIIIIIIIKLAPTVSVLKDMKKLELLYIVNRNAK